MGCSGSKKISASTLNGNGEKRAENQKEDLSDLNGHGQQGTADEETTREETIGDDIGGKSGVYAGEQGRSAGKEEVDNGISDADGHNDASAGN